MLKTILAVLILTTACLSQSRPSPFVGGGFALNGAGQSTFGGNLVGGVEWNTPHFLTIEEASYTTGGKTNDNDNTSSAGHTRHLMGDAYVRVGTWGFGPGASWSKLYTPAYTKSSVHPRLGVVKDFSCVRVSVTYVHPGTDWMNSVQGFEAAGWWGHNHLFFKMQLGGYWFHDTLTDRSNKPLTQSEKAHVLTTAHGQMVLGWRF